jgi:putative sigma-54 modulation protein
LQIEISSRTDRIPDEMRAYAAQKAERVLKYYDRLQGIRGVLDMEGPNFHCELIAEIEHMHDLIGEAQHEDMRAAVDQAVDKLERRLVQHKDRVRHRKGRGPNPHQPTIV